MNRPSAGVATRSWVSMIALSLSLGCSDSADDPSTDGSGATTANSVASDDTTSTGASAMGATATSGAGAGTAAATGGAEMQTAATTMGTMGVAEMGTADTASTGGSGMATTDTASTGGSMATTDAASAGGADMATADTASAGGAGMGGATATAAGGMPTGGSDAVEAAAGGSGGDAQAGGSGGSMPEGSAGMAGMGGSSAGNMMSPGCGSASPLQSGNITVNIDGTMRNYTVDVPANYDTNEPYRLIFVWHPLDGSAGQVVGGGYNGLKSLANDTAIFVAPDGLDGSNEEARGRGWWNVNGRDMAFFTSMFDNINANLCIDQDRVFSTGFSFGGMMSYAVGYQFDVFRAIAPCSGDMQVILPEENNTDPLPIMAFHGDNDPFVTTARGRAARDKYLMRNNCGTQTQPVDPSPCVEYQGCDVPTFWCEFPGAHTTWSEQPQAIWKFFSEF